MINRQKLIFSSALSASITIVFVVAITIAAEYLPVLKNTLKSWTGHHWTSKSLLTLAVYFIFLSAGYLASHAPKESAVRSSLIALIATFILGYLALLFFFLEHFLSK